MIVTEVRFYQPGGTLRPGAPSYVERRADSDLYEGLMGGEFCYVLTSRQMGKSSLMACTAARLREEGVAVAILDLTFVGQNLTPDQWYGSLLELMGRQLDLEDELEEYWLAHERESPLRRWRGALEEVALALCPGRVVLFVDEIDAVRSLPFSTDEFFAAIRACYNRRSEEPEFGRLTFCLLGVATPSDLIQDVRTTPFNIGRRIELTDFTSAEAAPLAAGLEPKYHGAGDYGGGHRPQGGPRRLGRAAGARPRSGGPGGGTGAQRRRGGPGETRRDTEEGGKEVDRSVRSSGHPVIRSSALLERVLYWTGGHPYLTQRLCQAIAADTAIADAASVDRLCEELFLSHGARERDDNLLFVRDRLLRNEADRAGLLDLYSQVCGRRRVRDEETNALVSVLKLSGIVRVVDGCLKVRNRIYARAFDRAWVMQHLPNAEMLRRVLNQVYNESILQNWGRVTVAKGLLDLIALGVTQYLVTAGVYHWLPYAVTWGIHQAILLATSLSVSTRASGMMPYVERHIWRNGLSLYASSFAIVALDLRFMGAARALEAIPAHLAVVSAIVCAYASLVDNRVVVTGAIFLGVAAILGLWPGFGFGILGIIWFLCLVIPGVCYLIDRQRLMASSRSTKL